MAIPWNCLCFGDSSELFMFWGEERGFGGGLVVISAGVNGDQSSLPGGENGKRLMVTEQGGEQLLLRNHTLLIIQSLTPSLPHSQSPMRKINLF